MLLDGKVAVVHGAGGAVGGAVARAFAREGARVALAGRSAAPLERVAAQIDRAGCAAVDVDVVDALDEAQAEAHADAVAAPAGRIDIVLNAISVDHVQGPPLAELPRDDVAGPVAARVATHLLSARSPRRS